MIFKKKHQYKSDSNFIFWIHLLLLALILASPILFSLTVIIIASVLFELQGILIGGCVLTFKQFGKSDMEMTFWYHLLSKFGIKVSKKKVKKFVTYLLPLTIITLAIFWQIIIGKKYVFF